MKADRDKIWDSSRYYRCRPALNESVATSKYLIDLDGTLLLFYRLADFSLVKTLEVLGKGDQFCAKLKVLSDRFVVAFGMNRFFIIDCEKLEISEKVEIDNMIECVEAKHEYIVVLTSDQDGESKLIYCWKIDENGKQAKKFETIQASIPDYQECTQENISLALIMALDSKPKIYIFWRNTNQMIEVDPLKRLSERYSRKKQLNFVTDINGDTYAEISQNKITINSKNGGKEFGVFTNEGQCFIKVFYQQKIGKEFYSISNNGVKRWKLQSDSQPVLYVESNVYPVEALYFGQGQQLIGINTDKKYVIVWQSHSSCQISKFPNEIIRKILKLNETQACLMIEATSSKIGQNQITVESHNKMEIYDFQQDKEVAKKAVLKLQYKIDIDSSIASGDNSVRFILNEECQNEIKKYIFRWSPFCQEKKKEVKKREIVGAKDFDSIKLYPFDRIVTFKKAKQTEMYDIFGKSSASKAVVSLYDFSAKKIGEYELSGDIQKVQMSQLNQLYAIGLQKFSIYSIDIASKNRLQKIHELQVSVNIVQPLGKYLLMKKENSIMIYDQQFELVMKQECDEDLKKFRILKIDEFNFILASKDGLKHWNLKAEETSALKLQGKDPNLVELMSAKHVVVVDKWIKAYDFQLLKQ